MNRSQQVRLTRITAHVFRCPIETPVMTSFGVMKNRPAVFVRVEDATGACGWGEIFANWPAAGAEHRARLLIEDISDLLIGARFDTPSAAFQTLEQKTHIRALQSGEWGPFRQVLAGVDTAMHDLFARNLGLPVRRMLNADAPASVPVYASGIFVRTAEAAIARSREIGFTRFKVKVGFDMQRDIDDVRACAAWLKDGETLCLDANQAWTVDEALHFADAVSGHNIGWLEEPIPADAPRDDWARLAAEMPIPMAGGENIAGTEAFAASIRDKQFTFYQPDIAKWGGFTGCMQVGQSALRAGAIYCPHFLGGIVGLHASAHLLAAVGGPGFLEVDVNPNPLRDACGPLKNYIQNGRWVMGDAIGLGLDDPIERLNQYETLEVSAE